LARAMWNGAVLADSDDIVVIEGNRYFPLASIDGRYFESSDRHTTCYWKGQASYFDVVVDGERNPAAAWFYPTPLPAAEAVEDRVAFWHGVQVEP